MTVRNLPLLEVGTPYQAVDFERFEYFGSRLTGGPTAILRLHLKNGTTIDLPATDDELRRLMHNLIEAFGPAAIEHLKALNWTS